MLCLARLLLSFCLPKALYARFGLLTLRSFLPSQILPASRLIIPLPHINNQYREAKKKYKKKLFGLYAVLKLLTVADQFSRGGGYYLQVGLGF